ncbi:MAG: hypothetical protein Q8K45_15250 [Rubrivivax sp.]|nr:hypothetical protein [Rubrivivax sp.]
MAAILGVILGISLDRSARYTAAMHPFDLFLRPAMRAASAPSCAEART